MCLYQAAHSYCLTDTLLQYSTWHCACVCGEECIYEACHLMWGWVFELIWHQWNWVKGLFSAEFYPVFKTLNTIQMCVFLHVQQLTPPSPSHHHNTPSSRLSPIFISPLLSRYLFHNLCSKCQGKMERSLLVSLLCVWALSSLSAASGEHVCVRGCLKENERIMDGFPCKTVFF